MPRGWNHISWMIDVLCNKITHTLASLPLFLNLFKREAFSDIFKVEERQQQRQESDV